MRGTAFCAEAIPQRRFGDRFAAIAPNDDGDCFAKTARNDTGLNGYLFRASILNLGRATGGTNNVALIISNDAATVFTGSWGIYDAMPEHWTLHRDSKRIYFGAAEDSYIEFDGDSMNIVANAVTATDDLNLTAQTTTIGDGGTTDYSKFEADGTLEFNGAATVWADENIGAALLSKPAASQPDEDNFLDEGGGDTGVTTLAFATGEKASGSLEIPHSYKNGSNFTFHVHWQGILAPAGGTDNVQWRLTYTVARSGATLDAATIVDSADTAIDAQYEFNQTDVTEIDGSTKGSNGGNVLIEDQLLFTLERVAATADDYAGDALVATIGIHYEQDTVGSRAILTK